LNYDNFIKIVLLYNRALINHTPLILIGETGCGKTYQINFFLEMLLRVPQENIKVKTLNAESKVSELVQAINDFRTKAEDPNRKNENFWIFFDEFNTSDFQTVLSELMNDRSSM
jgi:MoxR-like ATPase